MIAIVSIRTWWPGRDNLLPIPRTEQVQGELLIICKNLNLN